VSAFAQGSGLALDATDSVERATREERWSPTVAKLFIFSASLTLWAVIFLVVDFIA